MLYSLNYGCYNKKLKLLDCMSNKTLIDNFQYYQMVPSKNLGLKKKLQTSQKQPCYFK